MNADPRELISRSPMSRLQVAVVGITVALVLVYYMFIAAAGALERRSVPGMIALLWAPNAIGLSLASWILWRSDRSLSILPASFGARRGGK